MDARMIRVRCCVPFCRRTTKLQHDEWICGAHWTTVPREARVVFFRAKRRVTRNPTDERLWSAYRTIWRRLKRYAIERATGLG